MVDALASGASGSNPVEVQVLSSAPIQPGDPCGRFVVLPEEDLNRRRIQPEAVYGIIA
jgi:hypothetical protein